MLTLRSCIGRGWIRKRSFISDRHRGDGGILSIEPTNSARATYSAYSGEGGVGEEGVCALRLASGAAAAGAALALLAGAALFLTRDDAAVSVEALLARAGRGLRDAGIGIDGQDARIQDSRIQDSRIQDSRIVDPEAVRLAGLGEGAGQRRDLAAQSRRLTAEMEALDRALVQRRDELDLVGASVARLRLAAETDHETRRATEVAKAAADAGADEARAGIAAVGREMAALRAQVAEQREVLAAARTDVEAARSALTVLRAEIAEQAGRMEAARAEGEAGIRRIADRLAEFGRTARTNREAIGRIARTIDDLETSSRGPEAALQPEQWRAIQRALARTGHYPGKVDGRPGEETRAAVATYQRGLGAAATGRLSPGQIARLLALAPVQPPVAAP
ncbi:peptidoglycan-binding domain-containing protein [Methylobacterium terrae]|uniref:peptidoglycan-binding domain-containing protein n=1 Tax=Methylobacterium terrae TaxID=2202827 RepID=UPI0013A532D1|nr:peptidoglycan-binding domain-containing protein [Methylobacterium terrae]